jgi:hypothetical protein
MSQATKVIAALRHTNEATARAFCELVQRHFRNWLPPFKTIAATVRDNPTASAAEVAAHIARQAEVEALTQPKPAPKTRSHHTHRPVRGAAYPLIDRHEYETPAIGLSAQRQRNPARSRKRLEPDKAKKCSHGVAFYRKCAICDPEGFAESTGIG